VEGPGGLLWSVSGGLGGGVGSNANYYTDAGRNLVWRVSGAVDDHVENAPWLRVRREYIYLYIYTYIYI